MGSSYVMLDFESTDGYHYLPHRPVVRQNSKTTKVRMVFDASAKTTRNEACLNDCLHTGPALNTLLYDILLRFKMSKLAMTVDIEKAFLNIEVDEQDRDYLRFLWAMDPWAEKPVIERFRFCKVVFGVKSSPFLLNGTL